jgi:hypothetical protein
MKRSAPLRRGTPLVTRTPMKRSRMVRHPARRRAGADPGYLDRVRALPCCARGLPKATPCSDRVHAHHAGARPGVALKAHDHTATPLCDQHHRDWHDATGPFKVWNKEKRRAWAESQIARTQQLLGLAFDDEQDRRDEATETWPVRL